MFRARVERDPTHAGSPFLPLRSCVLVRVRLARRRGTAENFRRGGERAPSMLALIEATVGGLACAVWRDRGVSATVCVCSCADAPRGRAEKGRGVAPRGRMSTANDFCWNGSNYVEPYSTLARARISPQTSGLVPVELRTRALELGARSLRRAHMLSRRRRKFRLVERCDGDDDHRRLHWRQPSLAATNELQIAGVRHPPDPTHPTGDL